MKSSEIWGELAKKKEVSSFNKAKAFESNISNGRKIFRLLLWLNEIEAVHGHIHNQKLAPKVKVLKVISAVCSFIYYFTDNIVWFSKIGFLSKHVPFTHRMLGYHVKWGKIKDQFSLIKTALELTIFIYIYNLRKKEDNHLWNQLNQMDE